MENKKNLPLKIFHLVLIAAALVMSAFSIAKTGENVSELTELANALSIFTLAAGFIYLVYGYKKNAAVYYKIFMGLLVVSQGVFIAGLISGNETYPVYISLIYAIAFVTAVILAVAKDFGKNMTFAVCIALVACRIAILVINLLTAETFDNAAFCTLSSDISNLLIVGTAILMITEKYIDKSERGSK